MTILIQVVLNVTIQQTEQHFLNKYSSTEQLVLITILYFYQSLLMAFHYGEYQTIQTRHYELETERHNGFMLIVI